MRRSQLSSAAMVSTRSSKNSLPSSPTPTARSGRPPTTPRSNKSTRQKSAVGSVHSTGSAASKLASAADSDDDIIFSDSESVQPFKKPATLKSAASVKSETSTGSSRSNLPLNVEKALLQDITKSGGIALYDAGKSQGLCALLDSNREFFGARGDKTRTKIGQRVKYLKSLPDHKYKAVLKRVKVKVSKAEAAAATSAPPSAIKTKGRDDEFSDLENNNQEDDAEDNAVPDFVQSSVTKAKKSSLSSPAPVKVRSVASRGTPLPEVALSSPTPVKIRSASIRTPSSSRGPAPLATMDDNSKCLGAITIRSIVQMLTLAC